MLISQANKDHWVTTTVFVLGPPCLSMSPLEHYQIQCSSSSLTMKCVTICSIDASKNILIFVTPNNE